MSHGHISRNSDPIDRGNKVFHYPGTASFVGGRLLDPFVQYALLKYDWGRPLITLFGGSTLAQGPPLITNTPWDRLGLSPYRSIVLAMSVGSMLKHTYHITAINQERVSLARAVTFSLGSLVGNLACTLVFVCAQTSASTNGQHFPQTPLLVGSALYVAGMLVEVTSEQQRHSFKKDPANKGKIYEGGLFSLSRHINLFGYTLWRIGYAIATGGWLFGALIAGASTFQATGSIIPAHQHYLQEKYGEQFQHYQQTTPYMFIPWVY